MTETQQNDQVAPSPAAPRPQALLEQLLTAWITPVRFRIPSMPPIPTTPAQLFGVIASREVTWTIIAATVLCGVGPMVTSLLHAPDKLLFWFIVALTPFGVTYSSMTLAFLWTLISSVLGRTGPIHVSCVLTTFLAATASSLLGLGFFAILPQVLWPVSVREDPSLGFLITAVFPFCYLLPSMLLHAVVFRFLVPIGSARWKELGPRIDAETVSQIAEKRIRNLLVGPSTQVMSLGDKDIPTKSIRMVEAQGNYVRLLTDEGEVTIRKPFLKATETLPDALGIQLHRSRWVAFDAITKVENERDGLFVTVKGAPRIRVAKSRSSDVSEALASAGVPRDPANVPG